MKVVTWYIIHVPPIRINYIIYIISVMHHLILIWVGPDTALRMETLPLIPTVQNQRYLQHITLKDHLIN